MRNIKKYNLFEADYIRFDDDWGWGTETSYSSYTTPSTASTGYSSWRYPKSKPDLVDVSPYVDKIIVGDIIYHDEFGKGVVTKIKLYNDSFYFEIYFEDKRNRQIRTDACEYLKIDKDLVEYIKSRKSTKKIEEETPVEKKEETIEDLRKRVDGMQKRITMLNKDNVELRKDNNETKEYLNKVKSENKKQTEEIQKLQKQLDEYEALKDAMKEFKGKVDPFDEETWTKKKK